MFLNHSLFSAADPGIDDTLCFVLMPFGGDFDAMWEDIIRPAACEAGLTPHRADDIRKPGIIMQQVWQSILRARVLIADLTDSNANVFYELGLAHAIEKDVVLLAQNLKADLPFDLRHLRTIEYSLTLRGPQMLQESLTQTLSELLATPGQEAAAAFRVQATAEDRRTEQSGTNSGLEPYVSFEFRAGYLNGVPAQPEVEVENLGESLAINCLYGARFVSEGHEGGPAATGDRLERYYQYPLMAPHFTSPLNIAPGKPVHGAPAIITKPRPYFDAIFFAVPLRPGLVQVAVCEDKNGTRYRFRSDQSIVERWNPGEYRQTWSTWLDLMRADYQ